jgi:hypothetical protein
MRDPNVTELVNELNKHIDAVNKLNEKLYDQGVSYWLGVADHAIVLKDSFDRETNVKVLEVQYLKQTVEYQ